MVKFASIFFTNVKTDDNESQSACPCITTAGRRTSAAARQHTIGRTARTGDVNNAGTIQVTTTPLAGVVRRLGDRRPTVVDRRSLKDDTERSDRTRGREQPQKQSVEHQRYVLPVFFDLRRQTTRTHTQTMRSDRSFAFTLQCTMSAFHLSLSVYSFRYYVCVLCFIQ